jgi:Mn2+/Fe2+ NRAMP family transporter
MVTFLGLLINFTGIDPMRALVWAAIVNGIVAVPVMCLVMLMTGNRKVMSTFTVPPYLRIMGWLGTGLMVFAAVGMLLPGGK